ncbi:hypothetical protein SAMN05216387_101162 [Nitrosovibrio tenuis]|uniref:Transposase, Mutator family n=1 Tax=Nitrosovibrio tenuis TaxID=1233 RepID=A0A1H7G2R6_9PROT|nr:hypothetical protein SAMN05216387_101162 [Nitrosovibrio tenuis]
MLISSVEFYQPIFDICRGQINCPGLYKTANVLNKLPESQQLKAKAALQESGWPPTGKRGSVHLTVSSSTTRRSTQGGELPCQGSGGADCLLRFSSRTLAAYPDHQPDRLDLRHCTAAHCKNTRLCVSRGSMLAMVFTLAKSAEREWRRLKGAQRFAELLAVVQFKNGVPEKSKEIAA